MKVTTNLEPEMERRLSTSHLVTGSQVFHNGVPVQLLYRINQEKRYQTWCVRPLFVELPDRSERFYQCDRLSLLHTMRGSNWAQ
jgi:hypothetical protein